MITSKVIIVGGGPAGSSCAWQLQKAGIETIILDKKAFPRDKLCAGWIPPRVLSKLALYPASYPGQLTRFNTLHFYLYGRHLPVPTTQYAIRRSEFDQFLLKRSGVPTCVHQVKNIQCDKDEYIIDDTYRCQYVIGAGGTGCPVYRTFFRSENPRARDDQITTLELEYKFDYRDKKCFLWFFDHQLPGYSWYVPKKGGYLNIGIGAKAGTLISRGQSLQQHWNHFIEKLSNRKLIDDLPHQPRGYTYFLRHKIDSLQRDNAFIIGDSAGLATLDMGEGIGPAIESGILAAQSIIDGTEYSVRRIKRYSFINILFPGNVFR